MSTTLGPGVVEPEEAVIISGPRKGQFVQLGRDDGLLSIAEERAIEEFQAQAEATLQTARDAVAVIRKSREEYRASRLRNTHGMD